MLFFFGCFSLSLSLSHSSPPPPPPPSSQHPLVLLSAVDHFNRTQGDKKAGNNRSIGVLLGSWQGKLLDVANSFAVPFEEDPTNPEVYVCVFCSFFFFNLLSCSPLLFLSLILTRPLHRKEIGHLFRMGRHPALGADKVVLFYSLLFFPFLSFP